jgi:hypothetical protein
LYSAFESKSLFPGCQQALQLTADAIASAGLIVAQLSASTNVDKDSKCINEHANPAFAIAFVIVRFYFFSL